MATMAKWGSKTWEVSSKKILALEGLSFSYEQAADDNTSTEDKKTTNERGTELFPLSFSTTLHSGAGVDVRKEIESWEKLVTKVNTFYLNGKRLGPSKLQLRKVSVGDVTLDDFGRMRLAKLSLEFKEYDATAKSTSTKNAKASSSAKTEKKTTNTTVKKTSTEGFKVGDTVKILSKAKKYATGEKIPDYVKKNSHKIKQLKGTGAKRKALLGYPTGIRSWVYISDLSLAKIAPKGKTATTNKNNISKN